MPKFAGNIPHSFVSFRFIFFAMHVTQLRINKNESCQEATTTVCAEFNDKKLKLKARRSCLHATAIFRWHFCRIRLSAHLEYVSIVRTTTMSCVWHSDDVRRRGVWGSKGVYTITQLNTEKGTFYAWDLFLFIEQTIHKLDIRSVYFGFRFLLFRHEMGHDWKEMTNRAPHHARKMMELKGNHYYFLCMNVHFSQWPSCIAYKSMVVAERRSSLVRWPPLAFSSGGISFYRIKSHFRWPKDEIKQSGRVYSSFGDKQIWGRYLYSSWSLTKSDQAHDSCSVTMPCTFRWLFWKVTWRDRTHSKWSYLVAVIGTMRWK